ncbi:MAG: right-handed parallel beta-helix repeat-containing protein [Planctomycetaceae bacterium]|nr:right-handed parallel beta-helix repeat-containing protein [Planctomycetaceae bacterium]
MRLYLSSLTCLLLAAASAAGEIHVSPAGSDAADGTAAAPFATLAKARDAMRATIAGGMSADATIVLHGGKYYLDEPLRLDERDGGRGGHSVVYKSAAGEQAVLYAGKPVTGWQKWKGQIYRAPVPKDRRFFQLFNGLRDEPMARTPNRGSGYLGGRGAGRDGYFYPAGVLPDKFDFADANVFIWMKSNWFSNFCQVMAVDFAARRLTVSPQAGLEPYGGRAWIQGVLELLDEPGEWCLKHKEGWLYYWPRGPIERQEIVIPTAPRVLDIRGSGPDKQVSNIRIEGLTLGGTDFASSFGLAGNNSFSDANGAIHIENAHHITVEACKILNAGMAGVYMAGRAKNNTLKNCWIERAGFAGIYMCGFRPGDPQFTSAAESDVNKGHVITNNFIHDCGLFAGHGVGIQFYQSGDNEISHNRIARTPRYGISYKGLRMGALGKTLYGKAKTLETYFEAAHGRNVHVAYNDISNVCRDSHDCGAIESWGVGRDCVWEYNALHDIDKAVDWNGYGFVIYGDDGSHYLTMRGNVIYHCYGGGLFGMTNLKGLDNALENNVVADSSFGRTVTVFPQYEPGGNISISHNIFNMRGGLYTTGMNRAARLKEIDYNVIFPPHREFRRHGFDPHSVQEDPQFDRKGPAWDSTYADYALKPASPALKLGFKPIPLEKIGLTKDFPFDKSLMFRKAAADRIQAEDYDRMQALRTIGGTGVYDMGNGAWARYVNVDFGAGGHKTFKLMGDLGKDTTVTVHLDNPTGPVVATIKSADAKGAHLHTAPAAGATGAHTVYLVFTGGGFVDWFTFE